MGLIKAATGTVGGILADQWKEFFYCESMDSNVLMTKGVKRTSSRSSNTKASDNIISNGSGIAVADGQCMIIVEQGKVVEVCAEPGEFTYNSSTEPSIFAGNLGDSIKQTFSTIGKRFSYGGDTGKDQRIYYFNTKEILDNKFGTANPVPFRVVDEAIGFRISLHVRCSGTYSYKLVNPLLFYTNIAGNVSEEYTRDMIDGQLKTEFISALQPAMAGMSKYNLLPEDLVTHNTEIENELKNVLSKEWVENRGIQVCKVAFGSVTVPDEEQKKLNDAQEARFYGNAANASGLLTRSTANSMETAAGNSAGAMTGFMGMGMAMNQTGMNLGGLFQQAAQQPSNQQPANQQPANMQQPVQNAPIADSWTCVCGTKATGKFCPECGSPKPVAEAGWTCSCGSVNKGKFCTNCGAKKPEGAPLYRCDKCGWEPDDPHNPPKFCPQCGDKFDEADIK